MGSQIPVERLSESPRRSPDGVVMLWHDGCAVEVCQSRWKVEAAIFPRQAVNRSLKGANYKLQTSRGLIRLSIWNVRHYYIAK